MSQSTSTANLSGHSLTRDSLNAITDVEIAFGTTKLLPPFEQVPEEFKRGNAYTHLLDCMFSGNPLPPGFVKFREGFTDPAAPAQLLRVIRAHLQSFAPSHQHKIAGLAFLISQACELTPDGQHEALHQAT